MPQVFEHVIKLICDWTEVNNCFIFLHFIEIFLFYVEISLKVGKWKKKDIKFEQKKWLKRYVDLNKKLWSEAAN